MIYLSIFLIILLILSCYVTAEKSKVAKAIKRASLKQMLLDPLEGKKQKPKSHDKRQRTREHEIETSADDNASNGSN